MAALQGADGLPRGALPRTVVAAGLLPAAF